MLSKINKLYCLIAVTVLYLLLFVWQGLDFTDMGFWLTSYQQFYSQPATIWAPCWLTAFIGHWVGFILGGSVLAYKLGYIFVIAASAVISFLLLGSQIGKTWGLAALILLVVVFSRGYLGNWIDYNQLTALFYLCSATFLFFGLSNQRKFLIICAGIVIGANVFIRLPNLTGIALIAAIWFYGLVCRWSSRYIFVCTFLFVAGVTLGVALIWALIEVHGHGEMYIRGIRAIINEAYAANSPHPGGGLLKQLIHSHAIAFSEALFSIISFLIFSYLIKFYNDKYRRFFTGFTLIFGSIILFYISYYRGQSVAIYPGIFYLVLVGIIYSQLEQSQNLSLLAFISIVILFVTPLGSNNGISNSIFGMWLALPLSLSWLWCSTRENTHFSLKCQTKRLCVMYDSCWSQLILEFWLQLSHWL